MEIKLKQKFSTGSSCQIVGTVIILVSMMMPWLKMSSLFSDTNLSLLEIAQHHNALYANLIGYGMLLLSIGNLLYLLVRSSHKVSIALAAVTLINILVIFLTRGSLRRGESCSYSIGIGVFFTIAGILCLIYGIYLEMNDVQEDDNGEKVEEPATPPTVLPATEAQPVAVIKDGNEAEFVSAVNNQPKEEVAEANDYEADEYEESHSRRWWYIGGVAALLLIAGVVLFLTLGQKKKSHSYYDDDEEEETEMVERHHDKKLNLYGKIDQYPIVMKLTISGNKVKGSYYYESQGPDKVLDLSGIYDDGEMDLYETDEDGRQTGHFKGYIDDGEFSGNFTTMQGTKLSFRLRE